MADLMVANYLGMLLEDPYDTALVDGLRDALKRELGVEQNGHDPLRLIEAARGGHERRGEFLAAAWLMEIEADLVADDPDFQRILVKELGRVRRDELMDDRGAREAFERLGGRDSRDPEVAEAVEQIGQAEERWREIAARLVEEAREAADARLRTSLLTRAASLLWQYGGTELADESDALFDEALASDPSYMRTARQYALSLRARERWEDVASVFVRAARAARGRDEKASAWLQAARVMRRSMGDLESAAEAYKKVLEVSPTDEEALGALVQHFTDAEAWDDLAEIYESALRSRQKLEAEKGILLQLAMVHWRYRQDADAAEPFFARLRKIDAAHPGMLDFYRERIGDDDFEDRMLTILGDALRATTDRERQIEIARELGERAQATSRVDRAVEAWKLVDRLAPGDAHAREALRALYGDGGKWNALSESIRHEIEALPRDARAERLRLLRELVPIYRDKLHLDSMLIQVYGEILSNDPEDIEAINALSELYESSGRWNELIQVLDRQAEATSNPNKKVELYLRVARLWIDRFANLNQATRPLERVIALRPDHREALSELKDIYTKKRKWQALLDVMGKEAELMSDPDARLETTIAMAQLCTGRLHRNADAIELWKEVLQEAPDTPGALDTLEGLSEREKDWDTLAEALSRRAEAASTDQERVDSLQRLGVVLMDRLERRGEAIKAWEQVLEVTPGNTRVRRMLKNAYLAEQAWSALEKLYGQSGDWEGFAEVVSQAADRADASTSRVELSLRAAEIYTDKIGEPNRAIRSYERALVADPTNLEAAFALAPVYEREQKWERYASMLEVIEANAASDPTTLDERLARLERLRTIQLERLRDPAESFRWAAEAYKLVPTRREVLVGLEQSAEVAGAYDDFVALLRARVDDPEASDSERLDLHRRIATVAGERLGESADSIARLEEILRAEPEDAQAIAVLDRLYRAEQRFGDLQALYERRLKSASDPTERWVLLNEVAQLEEEELGDLESAAERHWQILEANPDDADALRSAERLSRQLKQWDRLDSVLERRLESGVGDDDRLPVLLQLGDLRRLHRADPEGALGAYRNALAIDGRSEVAAVGLEALVGAAPDLADHAVASLEDVYAKRGEFEKLANLLRRRLNQTTDEEDRRGLRLRLAELAASELGDAGGAYEALESAFLDNPDDLDLLDRLSGIAEAADRNESFVEALTLALEESTPSPETELALSRRTAELYDGVLGKPEAAARFHRRVLERHPEDALAFSALKQLYTKAEQWGELRGLYQNRIEATQDGAAKLDLLLQLCFLFEEILDEPTHAVTAYEQAIELDPGHHPSRRALQRLYARLERWPQLVELLQRDLDDAEGQEQVDLAYELATICENKLGRAGEAVEYYELVLQSSPTHLRAQEGLERLMEDREQRQRVAAILEPIFDSQGAWAELARVLAVQLDDLSDPNTRAAHLSRLGELSEAKLHDPSRAFEAYARAVREDPTDGSARSDLARLAEALGRQHERADILEQALPALGDDFVQTEVLLELAELWDTAEPDPERAERTYQQLVRLERDNPEIVIKASRALERLHTAASDHEALAQDLRRQIRFEEETSTRGELLSRLGDLLENELRDLDGAIEAHRERVELDPTNLEALLALHRLHERQGHWEPLIDTIEKRIALVDDDVEQLELWRSIANIFEDRLENLDGAVATYRDILSRFGSDEESLQALTRIYQSTDRWHELLDVTEMRAQDAGTEEERVALRFEAAELMRTRTEELERAFDVYRELLKEVPGHAPTVGALEQMAAESRSSFRIEAASLLFNHYQSAHQHDDQIRMLEVVATTEDRGARVDALLNAAEISEIGAEDVGRSFVLVGRALTEGVHPDGLEGALRDYRRYAEATERWPEYIETLIQIAPEVLDADRRVTIRIDAAQAATTQLGNTELARTQYEKILEDQPDHRPSLDALLDLVEYSGDASEWVELLRRKTELCESREERAALWVRQAELQERELADPEAAIDAYDQALLEGDPPEAYEGLERLYQQKRSWQNLASLYERQIDQRIGEPAAVRYQLGELCQRRLNDTWRAFDHYREALSQDPEHESTVHALEELTEQPEYRGAAAELLEPLYLRRMQWAKVTDILEARLEGEDDPVQRGELLRRLGDVQESHLEDLEGALETYSRLFAEDPHDHGSQETLTRLARVLGRWDRLAAAFDRALGAVEVDDEETARLALRTAKLYDERLDDVDKAAEYYQRAVAFDPSNKEASDALASVYARSRSWKKLLELNRERESFADGDFERVSILHDIGRIEAGEMQSPEDAILTYQRILEVDSKDRDAIALLDSLLEEHERWEELAEHIQFQIELTSNPRSALELKHRLGLVTRSRLDEPGRALDIFEDVLAEDTEYEPAVAAVTDLVEHVEHGDRAVEILEPIHRRAQSWPDLIFVLRAKAERANDSLAQSDTWREVAQLQEDRLQDPRAAFDAWGRALLSEPTDEEAQSETNRLALRLAAWDDFVELSEGAAAASKDPDTRGIFLRRIAETQDRELGDPRAAIRTYQRLLAVNDGADDALDALEALQVMVGDWEGLAEVYAKKLELYVDSDQRTEVLNRLAALWEEQLADSERAIDYYQQAIAESPEDETAYMALDRLFVTTNDNERLADILQRRLGIETDLETKIDVGLRLAELYETHLRRADAALDALGVVLEADADHTEALERLSRIHERQGHWSELVEVLQRRIDGIEQEEQRVGLTYQIGSIMERELDDELSAIAVYGQILRIDPGHEPSVQALLRIARLADYRDDAIALLEPYLREHERWDDLAQLFQIKADALADPFEKGEQLVALAEIHEHGRRDLNAAFEALLNAIAERPSDQKVVVRAETMAGTLGRWKDLTEVLLSQATSSLEPELAADLYQRVGRIAETELEDAGGAIDAYERALALVGDEPSVLQALDRLFEHTEQWERLHEVLGRRLDVGDEALRPSLLLRQGQLRASHLGDLEGALGAYHSVLEHQPGRDDAIAALRRLARKPNGGSGAIDLLEEYYRGAGELEEVVQLYEQRVKLADAEEDRVRLLVEAAGIWENEIGRPERAILSMRDAVRIDPRNQQLIESLERLAEGTDGWDRLRGLVEDIAVAGTLERRELYELRLRSVDWYLDRLGDASSAERSLVEALQLDPEPLEAHSRRVALLRDQGRDADLVGAMRAWADVESETEKRIELLREAATLARDALGDPELSADCYRELLAIDRKDPDALHGLCSIQEEQGRWNDVVGLLERRVEVSDDAVDQSALLRQMGSVYATHLSDARGAITVYERALALDDRDEASMDALEALYEQNDRLEALRALLERRVALAVGDAKAPLQLRLAHLYEHAFRDQDAAIRMFRDVLSSGPTDSTARDGLERLLAAQGNWDDLIQSLELRLDSASDGSQKRRLLERVALLHDEERSDPEAAIATFRTILEELGPDDSSLGHLVRLYREVEDWSAVAETLELRGARAEGAEAIDHLHEAADLWESRCQDPSRLSRALKQAYQRFPGDTRTRARLKAQQEAVGDYAGLAQVLDDELGDAASDEERLALLQRISDVYRGQLADPATAAQYLERAMEIKPDDRSVLVPLCDLYIAAGRQQDAVPILRRIIESYGRTRNKNLAAHYHRLGQALEAGGDVEGALQAYDAAFKIDLTNVGILRDLGKLTHAQGDLDRAQKSFRALLLQKLEPAAGIGKADVYYYLGDIAAKKDDPRKAITMLERALAEDKGHQDALHLLSELKS